jgi:sterol desaturase/sphingolipid hydroxylase (fatty acid hydroxylase superfamily)
MIERLKRQAWMLLLIKHSKIAYVMDFIAYFLAIIGICIYLALLPGILSPIQTFALVTLGLLSWSFMEYCLHRFILHQFSPFSDWHGEHHQQPRSLICTATLASMGLIFLFIFWPLNVVFNSSISSASTLGILLGYLSYAVTHHAIHHWDNCTYGWLLQRRYTHILHHTVSPNAHYGVTSNIWDYLLKTSYPQTNKI